MWNYNWGDKPWQYDDEYLVLLSRELNSKCDKQKELKQSRKNNTNLEEIKKLSYRICEWLPEELDYDFIKCRNYCYGGYNYRLEDGEDCYELCNSCKTLLDDKIRKPFNKTPREIGQEFQSLNNRIEMLEKQLKEIKDLL